MRHEETVGHTIEVTWEHELVIKALQPLPADRKCFRMIGNVVVERTVAEVLPAVQKNHDQVRHSHRCHTEGNLPRMVDRRLPILTPASRLCISQIAETISKFKETLAAKQKEADEFGAKHRITAQGGGGAASSAAPADDEGSAAGVLI